MSRDANSVILTVDEYRELIDSKVRFDAIVELAKCEKYAINKSVVLAIAGYYIEEGEKE